MDEPTIFPLEIQLGLVEGATPALASAAARALAETGATQDTALAPCAVNMASCGA